jgi:hypothetical protein
LIWEGNSGQRKAPYHEFRPNTNLGQSQLSHYLIFVCVSPTPHSDPLFPRVLHNRRKKLQIAPNPAQDFDLGIE